MLKVYWLGYGGSSWMAERLRHMIEDELGMKLITIHEHPDANIKWNLATVYQELKNADIIIVPANYKRQPCKSNNRVTQAMALGKPVICDPMPAYVPIIKQGINGFITLEGNEKEYKYLLNYLKDDKIRKEMGKNALETAKEYTQEKAVQKWISVLSNLPKKYKNDNKSLDVVIPTKNNLEILDECLKSFENSTLSEEVYIVDNGEGVEDLVKKYNIPYEVKEI